MVISGFHFSCLDQNFVYNWNNPLLTIHFFLVFCTLMKKEKSCVSFIQVLYTIESMPLVGEAIVCMQDNYDNLIKKHTIGGFCPLKFLL